MLPTLRMNRRFVEALLGERAPCFAMGLVAEGQTRYACLALRPVDDIPQTLTRGGFNFGHSVRGTDDFEVVHFGFEFYGTSLDIRTPTREPKRWGCEAIAH
jgi:hypothetical protein